MTTKEKAERLTAWDYIARACACQHTADMTDNVLLAIAADRSAQKYLELAKTAPIFAA